MGQRSMGVMQLLRVKKLSENAILPTRGSAVAAGYDLSSVTSTTVPARGKALTPTDLSFAIPEGPYARIGNYRISLQDLDWHGKTRSMLGAGVIDAAGVCRDNSVQPLGCGLRVGSGCF